MRRLCFIPMALLALAVAACGDDAGGSTATGASPTSLPTAASSTSTTTNAPTTTTPPVASTAPATTTAAAPPTTAVPGVVIVIEVVAGTSSGVDRYEVPLGDVVTMTVSADTADEMHIHGYDLFADLVPGESTTLEFVADIPGIFEVELEGAHSLLFELVVS